MIIGDERTWTRAAFDVAPAPDVAEALLVAPAGVDEVFAMTLGPPALDAIEESIRTAPADAAR